MSERQTENAMPYRRKRGAQPGNLNAMRNGHYTKVIVPEGAARLDPLQLADVDSSLSRLKKLMQVVYQAGLNAKTLSEVNETLRVLAMANNSYANLLNLRSRMTKPSNPA